MPNDANKVLLQKILKAKVQNGQAIDDLKYIDYPTRHAGICVISANGNRLGFLPYTYLNTEHTDRVWHQEKFSSYS